MYIASFYKVVFMRVFVTCDDQRAGQSNDHASDTDQPKDQRVDELAAGCQQGGEKHADGCRNE